MSLPSFKENWLFVRGTLKAHAVLSEVEGTTLCGRKDLKFEPSLGGIILDCYKCKACVKRLRKSNPFKTRPYEEIAKECGLREGSGTK